MLQLISNISITIYFLVLKMLILTSNALPKVTANTKTKTQCLAQVKECKGQHHIRILQILYISLLHQPYIPKLYNGKPTRKHERDLDQVFKIFQSYSVHICHLSTCNGPFPITIMRPKMLKKYMESSTLSQYMSSFRNMDMMMCC